MKHLLLLLILFALTQEKDELTLPRKHQHAQYIGCVFISGSETSARAKCRGYEEQIVFSFPRDHWPRHVPKTRWTQFYFEWAVKKQCKVVYAVDDARIVSGAAGHAPPHCD